MIFLLAALGLRLELDAARTLTVGGRPVIRNLPDKLSVSEDGGAGGVFLRAEFAREAAAHTIQLGTLECSRLLACARAEQWAGTFWSTLSGYIHRLRGYHGRGEESYYHTPGKLLDLRDKARIEADWTREHRVGWTDDEQGRVIDR